MNLVDANILIYAVNSDSPHHAPVRRWLEGTLSGTEPVGITWSVLLAFLRITTHSRVMEHPLSIDAAVVYIDSWLRHPSVELVVPGTNHWTILRTFIVATGTAGNLTSDAHLAAMALEGGWTLVSTDNDFHRFTGLPVLNPLVR